MRKALALAVAAAVLALAVKAARAGDAPIRLACYEHGLMNCTTCQGPQVALPALPALPYPGCCGQSLHDHARETLYHTGAALHSAARTVGHAARATVQGIGALAGASVNLLAHKVHRIKACIHNAWNASACSVCAGVPTVWAPPLVPTFQPGCSLCGPAVETAPAPPAPAPAPAAEPEVEQPKVPTPQPAAPEGSTQSRGKLQLIPAAGL